MSIQEKKPNEQGQYLCAKCETWKDPDKFSPGGTKSGLSSYCKWCMNIAQSESRAKKRKNTVTEGSYFIATVKRTGEIWLDSKFLPYNCDRVTERTVFATDPNGKEIGFCKAIFSFEVTMKGRRQLN